MEIIDKDVLGVTVRLSMDEVRALKQSNSAVSSDKLEDIRRALDYLTDKVDSLDSELECKKAESTILLKNIIDDLGMFC